MKPLISCIMPTYNRPLFVKHAIYLFLKQDYPNKELIIIDDGTIKALDTIPKDRRIKYFKFDTKRTIGFKRNFACKKAAGEIIMFWDDDDYYSSKRISYQTKPMFEKIADIVMLKNPIYYKNGQFFIPSQQHSDWLWEGTNGAHGGTMCFWSKLHGKIKFPHSNLGEDAIFFQHAKLAGAKLKTLPANKHFVYIRQPGSVFKFDMTDRKNWKQTSFQFPYVSKLFYK
tara:strand:- start:3086 stop:3766 length:681 start_codon:yes stop_codon:yes gene_type:complete